MRRPVGWRPITVVVGALAALAGCDDSPARTSPATTASASDAASPAEGGGVLEGVASTVTLPDDVGWTFDGERVTGSGARIRRWRQRPQPLFEACVVSVSEQPGYTGSFPTAELTAFVGTLDADAQIVRNEVLDPPPPGATAALAQAQTFDSPVRGGSPVQAHLYGRVAVTPAHVLVSVYAAAPDPVAHQCRPEDVVASLRLGTDSARSSSSSGGAR